MWQPTPYRIPVQLSATPLAPVLVATYPSGMPGRTVPDLRAAPAGSSTTKGVPMNLLLASSLVAAVLLAAVHALSPKLVFLDRVPRSRFLSFGGGVAVALVFLEIIPELAEFQSTVERKVGRSMGILRNHVYLIALFALTLFYTVQRHVQASRQQQQATTGEDKASRTLFWIDIGVVAAKTIIVGYLLVTAQPSLAALALFFFAIGLEFTIGDRGLHRDHKEDYDRLGRWILVAAVLGGWLVGYAAEVPPVGIAVLQSFLAGYIVLNVIKEELPRERQSRTGAFWAGVVVYAVVLLIQQSAAS